MPITSRTSRRLLSSKPSQNRAARPTRIRSEELPYLRLLCAVFNKPTHEMASQAPGKKNRPSD